MQSIAKIALIAAAAALAYLLERASIMWLCVLVLFNWEE